MVFWLPERPWKITPNLDLFFLIKNNTRKTHQISLFFKDLLPTFNNFWYFSWKKKISSDDVYTKPYDYILKAKH